MWPVFADPKTGFVFKRIFGAEDRKHLLMGLLNALLELDEAHRIVEVQHLPADQRIADRSSSNGPRRTCKVGRCG